MLPSQPRGLLIARSSPRLEPHLAPHTSRSTPTTVHLLTVWTKVLAASGRPGHNAISFSNELLRCRTRRTTGDLRATGRPEGPKTGGKVEGLFFCPPRHPCGNTTPRRAHTSPLAPHTSHLTQSLHHSKKCSFVHPVDKPLGTFHRPRNTSDSFSNRVAAIQGEGTGEAPRGDPQHLLDLDPRRVWLISGSFCFGAAPNL